MFNCLLNAGTLPDWLQGSLVRVGPGIFSVGETSYNHWFDGMALMHSFTIKDGKGFLLTNSNKIRSVYFSSKIYLKIYMICNCVMCSPFAI